MIRLGCSYANIFVPFTEISGQQAGQLCWLSPRDLAVPPFNFLLKFRCTWELYEKSGWPTELDKEMSVFPILCVGLTSAH